MACSCRETLVAYLDGELSTAEADAVRIHLEACEDCREYARLLSRSYDALRYLDVPEAPADMAAGIRARARRRSRVVFAYSVFAVAAALAIFAIVRAAIPRGDVLIPTAVPENLVLAESSSNGDDALDQMELLGDIDLVADVDVVEEFEMLAELDAIMDVEFSDREATI